MTLVRYKIFVQLLFLCDLNARGGNEIVTSSIDLGTLAGHSLNYNIITYSTVPTNEPVV